MKGFVGIGAFEKRIGTSKSEGEIKAKRKAESFAKVKKVVTERASDVNYLIKHSPVTASPLGRKAYRGSAPTNKFKKRFF